MRLSLTHTHTHTHRWFQPQGSLPAMFTLALAPDDLRTDLAQEGLVGHCGPREGPVYSLWGGEGEHGPPVEAAALPLELALAAAAVSVLRSRGTPAAASGRSGGDGSISDFRGCCLL